MPELENMKKGDVWSPGWCNFSEISPQFLSILSLNLQNQQANKVKKCWYAQMKDKRIKQELEVFFLTSQTKLSLFSSYFVLEMLNKQILFFESLFLKSTCFSMLEQLDLETLSKLHYLTRSRLVVLVSTLRTFSKFFLSTKT